MKRAAEPVFFESAAAWRTWLEKNHASAADLLVGFHRKAPGQKTLTYPQALDEALCFGWIDGVRRSLDGARWYIRFTPRKAKSIWSLVNIRHGQRLEKAGRMAAPGLKAFEGRDAKRSGLYSFEQRTAANLDRASAKAFRAKPRAWAFFQTQPPGYRRTTTFWVMSAKKPDTRARRLAQLVDDSGHGRRIALLTRPAGKETAGPR
jgi:uncharacterized protein YdeI (YjbR/CyaY-like superfamily)